MTNFRILVADDDEIARSGVCILLERETGWVVCGQSGTGSDAVELAVELQPEVIVLGLRDMQDLEKVREIRRQVSTPIVVIADDESAPLERAAIEAGANGFVMKTLAAASLRNAIRAALAPHGGERRHRKNRSDRGEDFAQLTPREREVLRLLAEGNTNRQIAERLGISVKTAETHHARINAKLKLHSVGQLVRYAIRQRIVEP
jgi:two-component system response regulator NreC